MADPQKDKSEALLRAFARHLDTLGGRYITTTDVGSTTRDLEHIALETKYVAGLPTSSGGSGDTSLLTGLGVYMGMKACANAVWGSDSLSDRTIAMQGFGKVAHYTAQHLLEEGADLVATDIYSRHWRRPGSWGPGPWTPKRFTTCPAIYFLHVRWEAF